jgi:F-type H+-transporting ATPase subunit delta
MKITAKQYAQTLYELTENKSEKEVSGVVSNFSKYLVKNNDLKLGAQVIEKFNNIWNEKHDIVEAEVTSRENLHTEVYTKVRTYVSNKYKAKEVVINNIIDKSIKGGIVIKVGDDILDGSVAGKLNNLKSILKK